jgi:hypothetical protein
VADKQQFLLHPPATANKHFKNSALDELTTPIKKGRIFTCPFTSLAFADT